MALAIDDHSPGFAVSPVWSRKTDSDYRRHQGMANRCNPAWIRSDSKLSDAWLYDTKTS
jgi:hypothetical protein